jgi:hypothetical protein
MLNPIAPPGLQGIGDASPDGYLDLSFEYVYNVTLTANQSLNGQLVSIFTQADFAWRALTFTSTGNFEVQFQDGQGYFLSSGLVYSTNMPNTPGDPWPRFPEVVYPAGGNIYLNITDLSGSGNTIQILFKGVNRYRLGNQG